MSALVDFVVVDEVAVRSLDPAPRRAKDLVREDREGRWNGDLALVDDAGVLPVEPCSGGAGVREPVEGDVVEDVVSCEIALGLPCKDVCDLLVTARVVVDHPGSQADRRISQALTDGL